MVDTPWLGQAFSFFCNGEHFAGVTASLTPPALTATTGEQRGGGMLGPITRVTGYEALEASIELSELPRAVAGLLGQADQDFTLIGSLERGNEAQKLEIIIRGQITAIEAEAWSGSDQNFGQRTLKIMADFYKETRDGTAWFEVDFINHKLVVDGQDRMAARRAALGL